MKYRVLVDFEVIQFMDELKPAHRQALQRRFIQMQDFSTRFVDYIEYDDSGRRIEISVVGRFAIKFWIDLWTGTSKCWKSRWPTEDRRSASAVGGRVQLRCARSAD